jgi:phosphoribosylformylglycinamidine synthase
MKLGVVRFPGTCDDVDAQLAAGKVGEAVLLWHGDRDLQGCDAIIVPGGFSYGDYLRAGAIARFAPIMEPVLEFARAGGPVLGICNGFQILCEAHLLPGALLPNTGLRFACRQLEVEVVRNDTAWTAACEPGQVLSIPAKNTTGRFFGEVPEDQVVLRYARDPIPNGSQDAIAGVCNEGRNVVGLMPHPEHAVDVLTGGSADGLEIFKSVVHAGASVAA